MALDSVGYYALPVIPSFEGMDRQVNSQMRKSFGGFGKTLGLDVGKGIGEGLKSSANEVESAAKAHADALDKVKDATGKLRAEEAKLEAARSNAASRAQAVGTAERRLKEMRATGTATDQQLATAERSVASARERARNAAAQATSVEQRVEATRRREATATREAQRAEQDLANARRNAGAAGGRGGMFGGFRQSMQTEGGGLASLAGGIGGKIGGAFMGALGAVVSVAAVGSLFKSAIDTGIEFERTVNAFSGVTAQAGDTAEMTGLRMEKMRQAARALGTDTQLAGVSASDAGKAMLELAKGGMTAEQAMAAARGTLQLATAGQLDAAQAAAIQSAAINTFSLKATDAMHVADLLAASANASSADVADLGYALQQGGAVAAGFGVSIEDTLTALTMFSRMGINGADAGTMLKTSLQAITDQGNPAQGAIEELGLQLYDANKQFVGVESMMKQVAAASTRMSEEEFQAATAVLFGSDAMRASMVAAKGGAQAWDDAAAAVNRQGAAAEMAAAQMQGLPGVVESLSNVWEGFKLKLFDVIDGPLIAIGNWFTDVLSGDGPKWLQDYGDTFREVFGKVGETVGPVFEQIKAAFSGIGNFISDTLGPQFVENLRNMGGPLSDLGKQLVATFKEAAPVLKLVGMIIGGALLGSLKAIGFVYPMVIRGMTAMAKVSQTIYQAIKVGAGIIGGVAQVIGSVFVGAWNLAKGAIGAAWSVIQPVFDAAKAAFGFLADAARYAFDTVILPMWHNFQLIAGATAQALAPVWNLLKAGYEIVSTAAVAFWQGAVVPVWEGIKGAFTAGWSAIQPIFEQIKGAFKGVSDFVSTVWSGLAGVVKSALDAVINAVKGPLRWIGGVLQKVPLKIGPVEIPGAQAAKDLGNTLAGLRDGGVVAGRTRDGRLFGPGTPTSDSILGVDTKGMPTAFVSTGEGVVAADAMRAGGAPVVAALNAGWVPSPEFLRGMLPGLARGGVVEEAEQFAQDQGDGRTYVYGGTGPGYDCSGFMSSIYAILTGQDPKRRYFTTESDFEALGFQPGYMPGAFNIGVSRGGGGRLSHMAGTLPNGVNVESGGSHNSTMYGGPAAGAQDFPLKFFLPVGGGDPAGAGTVAGGLSSAGSSYGGGGGSYGGGGGGGSADPAKVRDAEQRVADADQRIREADAKVAEEEAALRELKPDAKESQKLSAQRQLDAAKADADRARREKKDAEDKLGQLKSAGGGGQGASGDGQLGELGSIAKQFLSDAFGFGDLLPNPADLGIVKLASALMGIKYTPQGKGFPWESGYANGDGTPWSGSPVDPFAGMVDAAGGQLPLGMIPGVSSVLPDVTTPGGPVHAGTGAAPGPVDASTHITLNNPQGTPEQNETRVRRVLLKTPRYGTYTSNPGVMGT